MKPLIHILFLLALAAGSLLPTRSAAADSAAYLPIPAAQGEWEQAACQHMTAGGCTYFKQHDAAQAFALLQDARAIALFLSFDEKVSDLNGVVELWRVTVLIVTDEHEQAHTAYATVASGTRLLDRILTFDDVLLTEE